MFLRCTTAVRRRGSPQFRNPTSSLPRGGFGMKAKTFGLSTMRQHFSTCRSRLPAPLRGRTARLPSSKTCGFWVNLAALAWLEFSPLGRSMRPLRSTNRSGYRFWKQQARVVRSSCPIFLPSASCGEIRRSSFHPVMHPHSPQLARVCSMMRSSAFDWVEQRATGRNSTHQVAWRRKWRTSMAP